MGVKPGCPIKYKVKTLSLSKEPITSIGGFRVLPDYDINDLPDDHAGLILIGGMNWFFARGETHRIISGKSNCGKQTGCRNL